MAELWAVTTFPSHGRGPAVNPAAELDASRHPVALHALQSSCSSTESINFCKWHPTMPQLSVKRSDCYLHVHSYVYIDTSTAAQVSALVFSWPIRRRQVSRERPKCDTAVHRCPYRAGVYSDRYVLTSGHRIAISHDG